MQQRMRAHWFDCLEKKQFSVSNPKRMSAKKVRSNLVRLFQFTAFARNKAGINDTEEPLQTMVPCSVKTPKMPGFQEQRVALP